MKQSLVRRLAPRLNALDAGGYARGYVGKKVMSGSPLHQVLAELFDALGIRFKENVAVSGSSSLVADFVVNGTWVFVDKQLAEAEVKALRSRVKDCVLVNREKNRSDRSDHGIRVLGLDESGELQTIFLDDPSFNFDYAHILPRTKKCSVMHGHTSSVLVEVIGHPVDGMVVDFGVAKDVVREAVRELDHKLFIRKDYVTSMDDRRVSMKFRTVHGEFAIKAPKATTVTLEGEATVENLAKEVLSRVAEKMPGNVTAVGVYVYEGLNKGSHVLAQIHQSGVRRQRRKR